MDKANNKQIGGDHYKGAMQPWDFIISNNLGYLEGTAIKYLARWRKKNGVEDLRKAVHFIEKLIETELAKLPVPPVDSGSVFPRVRYESLPNDALVQLFRRRDDDEATWSPNLNTEAVLRPDTDDA